MTSPQEIEHVLSGFRFWLARWRREPLAYVLECLGEVPTHQQAQVLKAFESHNFVAVKSGHGIGKSKLMSWLVNWWLDTRGKRAPITGAGSDQLTTVVWPEVIQANGKKPEWLARQYESTQSELRQKANKEFGRAILRTVRMDADDALQGYHDCMFFIDEGSGVRDGIFEVASGALGDPGAYGFMTGNPTKLSGYFFNIFHRPSFWYTMSFSSEDTLAEKEYSYTYVDAFGDVREIRTHGRQTGQWVENMRKEYGSNSNAYRVRVLGQFATIGRDLVIEPRWVENMRCSPADAERMRKKKAKRRMGLDPAWVGEDDTGLVIREGSDILYATSWHGMDTVDTYNRAKMLFNEYDCDVLHIDTVGIGAGVYDNFLHTPYKGRMGYPVVRVHASEAAPYDKDGQCARLRDWLWWKSRKFFRTKSVSYLGQDKDPGYLTLKNELQEPTYRIKADGAIEIERKEEMKKRGLRSPNIADALNLTFFQDYEIFRETYVKNDDLQRRYKKKKKKTYLSWKSI